MSEEHHKVIQTMRDHHRFALQNDTVHVSQKFYDDLVESMKESNIGLNISAIQGLIALPEKQLLADEQLTRNAEILWKRLGIFL